jgi:maltose O-acetyltransferase
VRNLDLAELKLELRKLRRLRLRLRGDVDVDALVEQGLQLGHDVYLAPWVLIDYVAAYLISIGDGCVLAPRVHVLAHDASTRRALGYTRLAPVRIGRRVFIGADTLVLPGATIGDDSVIGAGSLVSSEIPAGSLAVGRPAKVIETSTEFFERRKQAMAGGPFFDVSERATPEGRQRLRSRVEEAGEGYIR